MLNVVEYVKTIKVIEKSKKRKIVKIQKKKLTKQLNFTHSR